jgi:hypothetical protein
MPPMIWDSLSPTSRLNKAIPQNMKYKVLIRYKDEDGTIKEESVPLPAQSERDAITQRRQHEEIAKRRYGRANFISVQLINE